MKLEIIQPQNQIKLISSGIQGPKGDTGPEGPRGFDTGTSGTSGTSGISGTSGTSGTSGQNGTSGVNGSSGSSGVSGSNGTSGTSGISGTSGSSGTSGLNGTFFGSSGISGSSGSSGTSGLSITWRGNWVLSDYRINDVVSYLGSVWISTINNNLNTPGGVGWNLLVQSGTSGSSGTSGINGTNGSNGTSGFTQDVSYFATTGSNTFIGNQFISGTLYFNDDYNSTQAAMGMFEAVSGSGSPLFDNISKDFGIISATSDITLVTLLNNAPPNTLTDVAQVSLTRSGSLDVYANINVSGSIIPNTGIGTNTSSFSLGSPTNAWKELYISQGSIIFVDAATQATSSFTIAANQEVQYSNGITASYYDGDGSRLTNLPSTTNWNKNKQYILRNTEQLTFSGDYILENCILLIEDDTELNSIGDWTTISFNRRGTVTANGDNGYIITGPADDSNASDLIMVRQYFENATTLSVDYTWNSEDVGNDWPFYDISEQEPTEPNNENRLVNTNAVSESGNWTLNVPANNWVVIGVWSNNSNANSGSLQITLPYTTNEDIQYSPNKYFKKEGSIFIGGNLLVKDSVIENNGRISVGGDVILIGNSQIVGTGTII